MSQRLQLPFVFAQARIGRFELLGPLRDPAFEVGLGTLQSGRQLLPGRQGFALRKILLALQAVDAVGQGEGQQQHFQCRPDLKGIQAEEIGRQDCQVAQTYDRHSDQERGPRQQESGSPGLACGPAPPPPKTRRRSAR